MQYRREIDGLRALAVIPVILFHAGFHSFSGGFVGVDVFFVISGYLITTIILMEIEHGKFSIVNFYDRRARRILPALFLVMGVSSIFAYAWMMPDEFKNFGQSLLATTIFSNNILLAITSGYWDLTSEFKPLLHTWSLGVEEQYYVIFPIFLLVCWKYFRKSLFVILIITAIASLLLANWGLTKSPSVTFYILPTRAWEILIGAMAAFYLNKSSIGTISHSTNQVFSFIGVLLILLPVLFFSRDYPSPGFWSLVPTVGTVLIIIFAKPETFVGDMLGSRSMVGVGLISYSFYLWHQPLFAFARIYSRTPPTLLVNTLLMFTSAILAYGTWRFIEGPFRNRKTFSRRFIFFFTVVISACFMIFGYYLNKSYGMPSRMFGPEVRIQDMDKRVYNERVFQFKKDGFVDSSKLKILVIGNSFGRDFVNMTNESFDVKNIEIVYRDDLLGCLIPFKNSVAEELYSATDVIVVTSDLQVDCVGKDIAFAQSRGKRIFYIGPKRFGYNMNWLIRLDPKDRPNQYNPLFASTVEDERQIVAAVPAQNFISLLAPVVKEGLIPVTDNAGYMLSTDRAHLTKYGAKFFGDRVLLKSAYGEILLNRH